MALPQNAKFTPEALFPGAAGTATCTFHTPAQGCRIGWRLLETAPCHLALRHPFQVPLLAGSSVTLGCMRIQFTETLNSLKQDEKQVALRTEVYTGI